jgi:hypothetical protein
MKWHRYTAYIAIVIFLIGIILFTHTLLDTLASFSDNIPSYDQYFVAGQWVCTYTLGYWKNNPAAWPVEEITIGGMDYTKEEALDILNTKHQGDATYILAYQLIAAKLNIISGTNSEVITETIDAADIWLLENPLSSDPRNPERKVGIQLSQTLSDYNDGVSGPCHYEYDVPYDEPTLSLTVTPSDVTTPDDQLTATPNASRTARASSTATSTPVTKPTEGTPSLTPPTLVVITLDHTSIPLPTITPSMTPSPSPSVSSTSPSKRVSPSASPSITPENTSSPTPAETQESPIAPTATWTPLSHDCTHSAGYWKNHPQEWPVGHFIIGGLAYTQSEAIEILNTPPRGDVTYMLFHQLISAILNVQNGADPDAIETIIEQADEWLIDNPLGSEPSGLERENGVQLTGRLESYNTGVIGPGMCAIETPTPTVTPSPTVIQTATQTQLPLATIPPTP